MYDRAMADEGARRSVIDALSAAARARIVEAAIEVDVPAGGIVYRENGRPRCVLVLEGLLRVYMTASDGRQVTIRYTREGSLLGIATAVGGPSPVGVEALTPARLRMLDAKLLAEEARRDPAVGWAFACELEARLSETLDYLAVSAFGSVRERIARHLLAVASPGRQGHPVALLTQEQLANAAGTVREVAARALRQLATAGLLRTRPGGVVLLDARALETIAKGPDEESA